MILIARITAAIDAAGTTATVLFGNRDWTTGPADSPPDTPVRGRLKEPGNLKRDLGSGQALFGTLRPGYGVATITISDGALDELADYGWGWRPYELWGVDAGPYDPLPAFPSGWTLLMSATIESAQATETELQLTLRDRLALLDKPVCGRYLGTGNEEGPVLLQQQARPWQAGHTCNVTPVLVDPPNLIYQVSSRPFCKPVNVYDRRAVITPTSNDDNDAASFAALQALTVTPGKFARCSNGSYFKLGSPPSTPVTCDVVSYASDSYTPSFGRQYVGQVLRDIAVGAGFADADIGASLDAMNVSNVGTYIRDTSTTWLQALGDAAASCGAWVGIDRLGVLQAGIVAAPSGSPVWTFRPGNCTSVSRVAGAYPVPIGTAVVRGGRNWTPQSASDVANSITGAARDLIAQEYTYSVSATGSALAKHLNAPTLTFDTDRGDVSLIGAATLPGAGVGVSPSSLISLFGVERVTMEVTAPLTVALLAAVDVGSVVWLEWPRFGLDAGRLLLCIGARLEFARERVTFVLWG